jgi:hypothetical protein
VRRARFAGLIVIACWVVGTAAPDLVLEEITTTPRVIVDGDQVRITATVRNEGDAAVTSPFYVTFQVDGRTLDAPSVPGGLLVGGYVTVSALWSATLGTHTLSATADDPLNRVSEPSEMNNRESVTVVVAADPEVEQRLATIKVAVAAFADRSASSIVDLGTEIAEGVAERLVESGVRVIGWDELEHHLRVSDMDPSSPADLATAARQLTADLLVSGEVSRFAITQTSYGIGLSVNAATVELDLAAELLNVATMDPSGQVTASSVEEGITGFSVDFLSVFGWLDRSVGENVCGGELTVAEDTLDVGDTVHIGYRNAGPAAWFDVEIVTGRETFVRWLGSRFIKSGSCGEWLWDQLDSSDVPVPPGLYIARLREDGELIDEDGFWVQPTVASAVETEAAISVGGADIADSIVGRATDSAVNQLTSGLIARLAELAMQQPAPTAAGRAEEPGTVVVDGQIAQLFADGRVAINIGASHGVSKWDVLQVLEVENVVTDPSGEDLLSYDIVSVRGEIYVVELGDLSAVAMTAGPFSPQVGDVVRLLEY